MRDMALRARKDALLTPVVVRFGAAIHPNVLSGVALLVGLAASVAVMTDHLLLGLALWLANRLLDGLDGLVARVYAKQSDFGAYLDLFTDFIVYLTIPLAFVYAQPTVFHFWAGLGLISSYVLNLLSWTVLSALLEKARATGKGRRTGIEMPAGLIEGAETILFYVSFFLWPAWIGWLFLAMALLVLITAAQRVVWAARHLPALG